MSDSLPPRGRLAGIDYGTVRIGISISDVERALATPFENYQRVNQQNDARRFLRLVEEDGVVGFVVGLPLHNDGQESQKSSEARRFGQWLAAVTGKPVVFHDERFTSVLAEQALGQAGLTKKKRRKRLDMLAAQFVLASYLESDQHLGSEKRDRDAAGRSLDD
jgi:putative pre-16S rRNA nuclease